MRRAALWLVLVACTLIPLIGVALAQTPNRAAIIVRAESGDVTQMCVSFEEAEITGAELLERSGIEYVQDANSLGTAVCSIEGDGCSADDCFCDYPTFWGYWTREDTADRWEFSNNGASDRTVRNGTLDGWSWGRDGKPPPPRLAFDEVCAADAAPAVTRTATPQQTRGVFPNYAAFAGFVAAFVAAATAAYFVRRRRRGPSGTSRRRRRRTRSRSAVPTSLPAVPDASSFAISHTTCTIAPAPIDRNNTASDRRVREAARPRADDRRRSGEETESDQRPQARTRTRQRRHDAEPLGDVVEHEAEDEERRQADLTERERRADRETLAEVVQADADAR